VFTQPPPDVLPDLAVVLLDVNRALAHSGLLLDKLFSYPQSLGVSSLLLPDKKFCLLNRRILLPRARLFFAMGRVNDAEQMFYEAWSLVGTRASVLRDLARLNMVKGRLEAARVYLNILKQVPFEQDWAVHIEQQMDKDPSLAWDGGLTRIKNSDFKEDSLGTAAYGPQEKPLVLLLKTNPQNKLAYQYLMATFLLSGQEDLLRQHLALLRNFGYTEIPKNCEEAVVSYVADRKLKSIDLYGYNVRRETVVQFNDFHVKARQCGKDAAALWRVMAGPLMETYWFNKAMGLIGIELKDGWITEVADAKP
jgi:hypothetical protein